MFFLMDIVAAAPKKLANKKHRVKIYKKTRKNMNKNKNKSS